MWYGFTNKLEKALVRGVVCLFVTVEENAQNENSFIDVALK